MRYLASISTTNSLTQWRPGRLSSPRLTCIWALVGLVGLTACMQVEDADALDGQEKQTASGSDCSVTHNEVIRHIQDHDRRRTEPFFPIEPLRLHQIYRATAEQAFTRLQTATLRGLFAVFSSTQVYLKIGEDIIAEDNDWKDSDLDNLPGDEPGVGRFLHAYPFEVRTAQMESEIELSVESNTQFLFDRPQAFCNP